MLCLRVVLFACSLASLLACLLCLLPCFLASLLPCLSISACFLAFLFLPPPRLHAVRKQEQPRQHRAVQQESATSSMTSRQNTDTPHVEPTANLQCFRAIFSSEQVFHVLTQTKGVPHFEALPPHSPIFHPSFLSLRPLRPHLPPPPKHESCVEQTWTWKSRTGARSQRKAAVPPHTSWSCPWSL